MAQYRVGRTTGMDIVMEKESGSLYGYIATWGFSEDGLKFLPGSFDKTVADRKGKIPLLTRHDNNGSSVLETIGWLVDGENDEKGYKARFDFIDTELAQAVREQGIKGGIKGLSIQAKSIQHEEKDGMIQVSEAKLIEVTATNVPWDVNAEVISVREVEGTVTMEPKANEDASTPDEQPPDVAQETVTVKNSLDAVLREQLIRLKELDHVT